MTKERIKEDNSFRWKQSPGVVCFSSYFENRRPLNMLIVWGHSEWNRRHWRYFRNAVIILNDGEARRNETKNLEEGCTERNKGNGIEYTWRRPHLGERKLGNSEVFLVVRKIAGDAQGGWLLPSRNARVKLFLLDKRCGGF